MPNCQYVPAKWRTEKDLETSQESCYSNKSGSQELQNHAPAKSSDDTSVNFMQFWIKKKKKNPANRMTEWLNIDQ